MKCTMQPFRSAVFMLGSLLTVGAVSFSSVIAASVAQDYTVTQNIAQGSIVSLNKNASEVVPANRDNLSNLHGIAVASADLSFSSDSNSSKTVSVSSSGVVDALVSNNNGPINVGDPITVDEVAGIGQKADLPTKIIGIAQASFDGKNSGSKQVQVGQNGSQKYIVINTIPVKIGVVDFTPDSGSANALESGSNRNKLLQVADGLAGKQIKPYALVIAGLLLLLGIFISVFLITSTSYASMIAIGRNPLSQKNIIQSLVRMIATAVVIFVAALLLSYAVIRLL